MNKTTGEGNAVQQVSLSRRICDEDEVHMSVERGGSLPMDHTASLQGTRGLDVGL